MKPATPRTGTFRGVKNSPFSTASSPMPSCCATMAFAPSLVGRVVIWEKTKLSIWNKTQNQGELVLNHSEMVKDGPSFCWIMKCEPSLGCVCCALNIGPETHGMKLPWALVPMSLGRIESVHPCFRMLSCCMVSMESHSNHILLDVS